MDVTRRVKLFGVKHAEQSSLFLRVELLAAYGGLSPSVYASAKV